MANDIIDTNNLPASTRGPADMPLTARGPSMLSRIKTNLQDPKKQKLIADMPSGTSDEPMLDVTQRSPESYDYITSGVKAMPRIQNIPSYDEGTDYVDRDQIAKLHEGEAVIPADENAHRMLIDGHPVERGDASIEQRPSEQPQERPAMRNPYGEDDAKRSLIRDDIEQAQKKGDLLGMGKGLLNERIINRGDASMEKRPMEQLPEAPSLDSLPRIAGTRAGGSPEAMPEVKPTLVPYKEQVANLKEIIRTGSREDAANAEERLARLEKGTPWGSPENHPGFLGKIGHIASEVGQAALMPTAPYLLNAIPGTQRRLAAEEQQGIGKIKELQGEDLTKAETAKNLATVKAAGKTPPEQVLNDLMTGDNGKPRTDSTGKPYTFETAYQRVSELGQEAKPVDQTKQPVGDAGVERHGKVLDTLTQGMSPEEAATFRNAYSAKPDDTLAVQTKRAEDARAAAGMSGAERDRKLQRDQQQKNHEESMAATAAARAASEGNKDKAAAIRERQEVAKIYTDPLQSAERFNIMTTNLKKALPESEGGNNDQQAMLVCWQTTLA